MAIFSIQPLLCLSTYALASDLKPTWLISDRGSANIGIQGMGLAIDTSGYVYVAGTETLVGAITLRPLIRKYDQGGRLVWEFMPESHKIYSESRAEDVAIDRSGNFYITGHLGQKLWVGKYSSSRKPLWERFYGGHYRSVGRKIVVDEEGCVYVAGYSNNPPEPMESLNMATCCEDIWVSKHSPDGEAIWISTVSGTSPSNDRAVDIEVDHSRNIYVAGRLGGLGWIGRFEPTGELAWGTTVAHLAPVLTVLDDRTILVAMSMSYQRSLELMALDPAGHRTWMKSYPVLPGRHAASWFFEVKDIMKAPSGHLYAIGNKLFPATQSGSSSNSIWLGQIDLVRGIVREFHHEGRPPHLETPPKNLYLDEGNALAIDNYGSLYAVGKTIQAGLWLGRFEPMGRVASVTQIHQRPVQGEQGNAATGAPQELVAMAITFSIRYRNPEGFSIVSLDKRKQQRPDSTRVVEAHYKVDGALRPQTVSCWASVKSITLPTKITHVWSADGKEVARILIPVTSSPFRNWSSKKLWPAQWKVDVRGEDGTVLGSLKFQAR